MDHAPLSYGPLDPGAALVAPLIRDEDSPAPVVARGLIGESALMDRLRMQLELIALARRTTLISGPTGSGKEVVAVALHRAARHSGRAPYVPVHCGALPEQLAEAELFGHTRGAFTSAVQARAGLIRSAAGGTLFLDEVDSLAPTVQAKLLRFLETGEYRAVGSDKTECADIWIIAATNSDLQARVRSGAFREDLFYRLDVLRLDVPALRLRGGDIELLANHFLLGADGCARRFTARAVQALYAHDWPGNVRELKHRVERATLLTRSAEIDAEDLGLGAAQPRRDPRPASGPDGLAPAANDGEVPVARSVQDLWKMIERDGFSLAQTLEHCERLLIEAALVAERDNRTRAAQRLGIHVRTIFKKLSR
jgi:DNA-binding NtrC family response regulator